jgi:hypothetical protein
VRVISELDDLFDISYYLEPRDGVEPGTRPQVLEDYWSANK